MASSRDDDALRAIKFMAMKALVFMALPAVLAVFVVLIVL